MPHVYHMPRVNFNHPQGFAIGSSTWCCSHRHGALTVIRTYTSHLHNGVRQTCSVALYTKVLTRCQRFMVEDGKIAPDLPTFNVSSTCFFDYGSITSYHLTVCLDSRRGRSLLGRYWRCIAHNGCNIGYSTVSFKAQPVSNASVRAPVDHRRLIEPSRTERESPFDWFQLFLFNTGTCCGCKGDGAC